VCPQAKVGDLAARPPEMCYHDAELEGDLEYRAFIQRTAAKIRTFLLGKWRRVPAAPRARIRLFAGLARAALVHVAPKCAPPFLAVY